MKKPEEKINETAASTSPPSQQQESLPDHVDFQTQVLFSDPLQGAQVLLYVIVFTIMTFIIWAYFAKIDERTFAEGKVIPSMKVQEIQNLEGGILKKLYVKEGDIVKKNQILIQLDDTAFSSKHQEHSAKFYALSAKKARLTAESTHAKRINFPSELREKYPDIVTQEEHLFSSNQDQIHTTTNNLKKTLALAQQELNITKPLAKKKLVPKLDVLKLKREISEIEGKLNAVSKEYQVKVHAELAKTNADLNALHETLVGLKDKQTRTTIRSPVHGIIKKINIDTLGGVIKPGEDIMEVVPLDEQLLVEGKINPSKIAFIHPGQEANVRISAYDATIYGSLKAKVQRISADAIIEKDAYGRDETVYRVIVKTDKNYLMYNNEKLPIIPGMQATASILTGEKTLLSYLLKPILKAKQNALRER